LATSLHSPAVVKSPLFLPVYPSSLAKGWVRQAFAWKEQWAGHKLLAPPLQVEWMVTGREPQLTADHQGSG